MTNHASAHYKILREGNEVWNRWAATCLTHNNKAPESDTPSPFDDAELNELKIKIGDELPRRDEPIIFSGRNLQTDSFLGLHFYTTTIFSDVALQNRIKFNNCIFYDRTTYESIESCDELWFQDCTFDDLIITNNQNLAYIDLSNCSISGSTEIASISNVITNIGDSSFTGELELHTTQETISTYIQESTFKGGIDCSNAKIESLVFYKGCNVQKEFKLENASATSIDISKATIDGPFLCSGSEFLEKASFVGVVFELFADFKNVTFSKSADFTNCKFNAGGSFEGTIFNKPPIFHGAHLHQGVTFENTSFTIISSDDSDYANEWRTLKHAMNTNHNREQEIRFFGYEMECKRMRLYRNNKISSFGLDGYAHLSNYGQSIGKPLAWLAFSSAFFGLVYLTLGASNPAKITLASALPFLGFLKMSLTGENLLIIIVSAIQVIWSTLMIFLIGLGLRNRFMMK